jgi:hypothetical protein
VKVAKGERVSYAERLIGTKFDIGPDYVSVLYRGIVLPETLNLMRFYSPKTKLEADFNE